jgi:hypothetical protein
VGEIRHEYKLLVGKSLGNRKLGRPWGRIWEDIIKMDINEVG